MSDTETVEGIVTAFYPSEGDNDPHNVYVNNNRFSTFDDDTVAEIEEGIQVEFEAEQNGDYWNIVGGSVEVVESGEESPTGEIEPMSLNDARVSSQSVLRSAVLHHQHREDSTAEDVVETAKTFADAQVALYERLRQVGRDGGQ